MAGVISSLGLGSGVLTSDVIDKLKANDQTLTVTPIDNKITLNTQKQQALSLLQSLTTSFNSSVSSLQDSSLYQKRTVSGSNDGVSVTADTGVAIQDFSISDTKLATTNVIQSGTFSSSSLSVASASGTMNLNINGTDYQIAYDSSTTYDDLKTKINDVAGSDVTASILQTGDGAYSLVINSKTTGKDQQMTLTDLGTSGGASALNSNLVNDSLTSGAFTSKTSAIASGSGTLTLNAAGVDTTFNYSSSTSLTDLADMINSDATASQSVYASVIKDLNGEYRLSLSAKSGGENQSISITDQASGGTLDTNLTSNSWVDGGMSDIQTASDSSFKYNGITLTRSSNTITDITVGLTINLLSDNSSANISITQDAQPIKDALQSLVDSYNTMSKQLDSMTLTDTEAGKVGIFNGDNSINSIGRDIRSILSSVDSNTGLGLAQYGVTLNRDGTLSFDSSTFDTKMAEDPDAMATYFSGSTTVDSNGNTTTTDGVFNTLYDNLKNLTATNGTLTALGDGLTTEGKSLADDRTKALDLLNSKYDTMTARFIEYDSIISNMNNQFSALQQQISMAISGK
ncbi:flagellar filament capping protein FliD [Sulfurimonas sp. HSL-1716]|uniref:flagellar filament capping protein FliD n=1 Tax=Hydrocurvibacter sulfurireducens TaxID=3131937 RepID=UPI0031FA155C